MGPLCRKFLQCAGSGTAPVVAVQCPTKEVFDDRDLVVKGAGVAYHNGFGVATSRAKVEDQRFDLARAEHSAAGEVIIEIKPMDDLRPIIDSAESAEIMFQRGRLDPVTPITNRPSGGNTHRYPGSPLDETREPLA